MSYERLLGEGRIKKVSRKETDLSLAERDLSAAKNSLDAEDYDWALSIAYNAALQAARAYMFSKGYRPDGKNQHKTVFEFLEGFDDELIDYFDTIRKKRHIAVYDIVESVSESMAKECLEKAKDFVHKIRTLVHKKGTEDE